MAKKQVGVSLRKPPPSADLEAFVSSGSAANATRLAELRASEGDMGRDTTPAPVSAEILVAARDGRTLREMTLYLEKDLAQKLALHCAECDCDMSNVIADAVSKHLDKVAGVTVGVKSTPTRPELPRSPVAEAPRVVRMKAAPMKAAPPKPAPRPTIVTHWNRAMDLMRSRLAGKMGR